MTAEARGSLWFSLELAEIALENVPDGAAFTSEREEIRHYIEEVEALLEGQIHEDYEEWGL